MIVTQEIINQAIKESTNKAFNKTTILKNGSGQLAGNIGEIAFKVGLDGNKIKNHRVGKDVYDYDFVAEGITIDVKCKDRNVTCSTEYNAHVNVSQRNFNCFLYVFCSYNKKISEIEFLGYIRKKDYWDKCTIYKKGQKDDEGFTHRSDCGVLKYKHLKPIQNIKEFILEI